MKKTVVFFTLLIACVAIFAQSGPTFPYQAVVRNSQNKLIKDSTFAIGVEVYQGATLKFSETQSVTTNANGQFTMNIGGGTFVSGAMNGVADWSVAKFKITYHLSEGDIVSENAVSPVPYALQAANVTSGNFLTSDSVVITTMQNDIATNTTNIATNATNIATNTADIAALANRVNTFNTNVCDSVATCVGNAIDARGFLTSDSAVITTMQGNIATNAADIAALANRVNTFNTNVCDSVATCVGNAIDARNFLTSDSAVITTMQSDIATNATNISTNANDIAALTNRVNTFNTNVCDSVATCVGNAIDARGFLTSDSVVITTMQNDIAAAIAKEKTDSNTLASRIDALENASLDCDDVKNCIKDTLSNYTTTTALTDLLREIKDRMDAQDAKIDSLRHLVDSLSGGGDTPTEVAAGQPCPGAPTVTDVDGNEYNTVKIGNQCWTKENLRTNVGGSVYPIRGNETVTGEDTITYGRLYTWDAMMNNTASTNYPVSGSKVQGICPAGWHVPSDAEWDTLTHYVFSKDEYKCGSSCGEWQAQRDVSCIAKALSSTTGWSSNTGSGCNAGNTGDKANATGFSAVPAGFYHGFFSLFGKLAYFWSATQFDNSIACCRRLDGDASNVGWYYAEKYYGFSVRCLRDAGVGGGDTPDTPGGGETAIVDTVFCYPNLGASTPDTNTVTRGENFNLSSVTFTHPVEANNWEIASWNTSSDGTGTSYATNATFTTTGNLTLYAQWRTFCTGTPSSANEVGSGRIDSVKDVDNNKYAVVQIGSQCWMKENMKTTQYANGEAISVYKMFNPNNSADNVAIYGKLYTWSAATRDSSTTYPADGQVKVQGICPAGWHVPSGAEWK